MPNIVIVSNRLPVSVKKVNGKLEFQSITGGVAIGLSNYTKQRGSKWIGWPGIPSDDLTGADKARIRRELKKSRCYPVFLTQKQVDDFYSGYSNGVLWPLMHNLAYENPRPKWWHAYQTVNNLYAEEIVRMSRPGSTIWVHDYQLMLVPKAIRAAGRTDRIGFFLHIPFPKPNVLNQLAQAKTLLQGVLGADLIGFHTKRYSEQFLHGTDELLGTMRDRTQLLVGNRNVLVAEFPMGIDYNRFATATKVRSKRRQAQKLRRQYKGQKVIVSVDRLDMTKGLVERIKAYQQLLVEYPSLVGKVVMVMIVAPSRTDVPAYKRLKMQVDKALADINAKFATPSWKPIDFIYEIVPIEDVMAYYQMADVGFIAPLIDGMNLVAKEFVASKRRNDGVLVLSETAGAAEELRDAVLVNPRKPHTMIAGLYTALTMPRRELRRRARDMQEQIKNSPVQKWAETFMETLQQPRALSPVVPRKTRAMNEGQSVKLVERYRRSGSRLLLFDYDGVLQGFHANPAAARPSKQVLRLLQKLSNDAKNYVMIVSGRPRSDLQAWFGHLPVALAAEHGALIRRKGGKNWHHTSSNNTAWQRQIVDLFEHYVELTPGTLIEQKEWGVTWHYRSAKPYAAQKNLVVLRRLLKPLAKKNDLQVLEGNKVIEVRPSDVSKRRAAQEWLIHDHDFIMAIGDDTTDEDMFTALPPAAYTIKVGRGQTAARYRLKDVPAVLELLQKL